jgi:uroporphyrinogen-III synthase
MIDEPSWLAHQIIAVESLYAVLYREQAISYRQVSYIADATGARYKRTTFTSSSTANMLCKKLNKLFHTNDFTVRAINSVWVKPTQDVSQTSSAKHTFEYPL